MVVAAAAAAAAAGRLVEVRSGGADTSRKATFLGDFASTKIEARNRVNDLVPTKTGDLLWRKLNASKAAANSPTTVRNRNSFPAT